MMAELHINATMDYDKTVWGEGYVAEWWRYLLLESTWVLYGVIPTVCVLIAYVSTALCLEWIVRQPWAAKYHIHWSDKTSRNEDIAATRAKFPLDTQFKEALSVFTGVNGLVSILGLATVFPMFLERPSTPFPGSFLFVLFQIELLLYIDDFFLYWGHRVQHEVEFLWKRLHYYHHQVRTPTPISAVFIDTIDATLQASLPMVFAVLTVQPHPATMILFFGRRVSQNVMHHCGMEGFWPVEMFFFKFLPGRAKVSHHDGHHRFCNHAAHAKNYGEHTWVWDWMFGTLTNRTPKSKQV
eukprot:m.90563 g.90563  ORF g.90563 m.90563 type:complete len:297 (-) comp26410_c0_seq1:112-1002(-)